MSTGVLGPGRARIKAKTMRGDRWWLAPLTTFVVFTAFVVYATWRAFMGSDYYSSPYLSPFYSPCLTTECVEGLLGLRTAVLVVAAVAGAHHPDLPARLPDVVLLLPQGVLPGVLAFTACMRGRRAPQGLQRRDPIPLIIQNIHRCFFYAAVPCRTDPELRRPAGLPQRGPRKSAPASAR